MRRGVVETDNCFSIRGTLELKHPEEIEDVQCDHLYSLTEVFEVSAW